MRETVKFKIPNLCTQKNIKNPQRTRIVEQYMSAINHDDVYIHTYARVIFVKILGKFY